MSGDRLLEAVLAARGDRRPSAVEAEELAFAGMLVSARRQEQDGPHCPDRARHRAYGLFERLPEGLWESLARLVFDSWQPEAGVPAPAARSLGTERLMIYESGVGSLDLQLGQSADGDGVTLVVAIQGGGDDLRIEVVLDGEAPGIAIDIDEHGTGSVQIDGRHHEAVVVVRDVDGEVLRTPVVPLR